jgi:capsular polysaccharide biosynthesis protein/MinD-like ATPase involved in chromosome partitioning or flagellar assembly
MTTTAEGQTEEQGFSLRNYLEVLRRRKWIALLTLALALGASAAITFSTDPTYQAKTKIVVGQGTGLFQPDRAGAVGPFTATMSDLVESTVVASGVVEELGLDESPGALLARLDVSFSPETSVLDLRFRDRSPERARAIADSFGRVFSELVEERFGQPTTDQAASDQLPLTATVWDPASVSHKPIKPRHVRDLLIAGALGTLLAVLAAFLAEHFDRSLRNPDSVEKHLGVPVIGQIPFKRRREPTSVVLWNGYREGAEAYLTLRANLQYLAIKRPLRTLLITSPAPEQGKTTVTANLAVAVARSGASTAVVEADLRRPRLSDAFGVQPDARRGLTDVLVGSVDLTTALVDVPVAPESNLGAALRHPDGGNGATPGDKPTPIHLLQAGPLPPNPTELLSSHQMTEVLDRLGGQHAYVLVDSPPLLLVPDALELARSVDGVILVVRRNRSTLDEMREVRATIGRVGIALLGVVFTDAEPRSVYYGHYGHYGQYGHAHDRH